MINLNLLAKALKLVAREEEAYLNLKKVFGVIVDEYEFESVREMEVLYLYGTYGMDFEESLRQTNFHMDYVRKRPNLCSQLSDRELIIFKFNL